MTMACNYDLLNVHMEAIKLSQSWPCKRPDEDKEDHTYIHRQGLRTNIMKGIMKLQFIKQNTGNILLHFEL